MSRVITDGVPVPDDDPKPSVSAFEFLRQAKRQRAEQQKQAPELTVSGGWAVEPPEEKASKRGKLSWSDRFLMVFPLTIISVTLFLLIGGQPALDLIWIFPPTKWQKEELVRRQWLKEKNDIQDLVYAEYFEAIDKPYAEYAEYAEAVDKADAASDAVKKVELSIEGRIKTLEADCDQRYEELERGLKQKYPQFYKGAGK